MVKKETEARHDVADNAAEQSFCRFIETMPEVCISINSRSFLC